MKNGQKKMFNLREKKIFTILFAALAGGTYWCTVRPSGYGSGPSLGLMWGLYWTLLSWMLFSQETRPKTFPSQSLYVLLVLAIGFGLGGMQGYGQFNQWMRGDFHLKTNANVIVPISPMYGFYHLSICGLTWGGIPALFLAWLLTSKNTPKDWILRVF